MASFIANLWNRFCSKQAPLTVMTVGLDNSGKTSLLSHIKLTSFAPRQTSSSSNSGKSNETKLHLASDNDARPRNEDDSWPPHDNETVFIEAPTSNGASFSLNKEENVAPTIGYNFDTIQYKGHTINVLDFSGQSKYRVLWQEFYNCVDAIVFVLDSSDLIRLVVARDELENMLSHPYFDSLGPTSAQQNTSMGVQDSKLTFQVAQKQLVISKGKLFQSPLGSDDETKSKRVKLGKDQQPGGGTRGGRRRTRIPILFLANKTDLTNAADTELIAKTLNLAELPQSRHPWHIQATSVQTSQCIQEGFDWLVKELLQQAGGEQASL